MKDYITMSTLLPIGMVLTLGTGVWWAADLSAKVRFNSEIVAEMQTDVRQMKTDIAAIRERLGSKAVGLKPGL